MARARTLGFVVALVVASVPPVHAATQPFTCNGAIATILGTARADVIDGTPGDDVIVAFAGDDVVRGRGGNDLICAGAGDDTILGGKGDDVLFAGAGNDSVFGHSGSDTIHGGPDRDRLNGGHGDDGLHGERGIDVLVGGPGADHLFGGMGNDVLHGREGSDTLYGGRGNDRLEGDAQWDACSGGPGVDTAASCENPTTTEHGNRPPIRIAPASGSVALTFDDGPHPTWTPRVLDELARLGVKATFFVNGNKVARYPDLVVRMIAEGHSVQNHTWSHGWLTRLSDSSARREIARGRDAIEAVTGFTPRCLRPPFGAQNNRITAIAASEGQTMVRWSVDPQDWRYPGVSAITRHVVRYSGSRSVILLHDTHSQSLGSISGIVGGIRAKGLEFATICD